METFAESNAQSCSANLVPYQDYSNDEISTSVSGTPLRTELVGLVIKVWDPLDLTRPLQTEFGCYQPRSSNIGDQLCEFPSPHKRSLSQTRWRLCGTVIIS